MRCEVAGKAVSRILRAGQALIGIALLAVCVKAVVEIASEAPAIT